MPAMVVVLSNGYGKRRVLVDRIHSIVSNRTRQDEEEYLVRWNSTSPTDSPPLSWHAISELSRCLELVQDYLNAREKMLKVESQTNKTSLKHKLSVDSMTVKRQKSTTPNSPKLQSTTITTSVPDVYNGVLDVDSNGFIYCRPASGPDVKQANINTIINDDLVELAHRASVKKALIAIRKTYVRRLNRVPGKRIELINTIDSSTPSLRFQYIQDYVLDEKNGVMRAPQDTQVGCTDCRPDMGRNIGCEYTKKCHCLEYADVNEAQLTDPTKLAEYHRALESGSSTIGFPKRFPYFVEGTNNRRAGCLVPFYLNSRCTIFECNDRCHCGPSCRNKNVQFGRKVELQVFKTADGRGWGLRCLQDLHEGQFLDTYRGEIITDLEATRRHEASRKGRHSYLFSLDKFAETENIPTQEIYVVDGEFMGGPTVFMNHSCEPNCRQYTLSYNKHDHKVYDLAFFACRDIPAGEELTFDYKDGNEDVRDSDGGEDPNQAPGNDAVPCYCGSSKCRRWLWT